MWEGMERFLKSMDLVGRSCVELNEFKHSAEIQFQRHMDKIETNVPQNVYEAGLSNLKDTLEAKMNAAFADFQAQITKNMGKTERRLDNFDKALKQVEADTYWKIKDYEKLLEMRPTMNHVRQAMEEEGRNFLVAGRQYTDDEINKLKNSAMAIEKMF